KLPPFARNDLRFSALRLGARQRRRRCRFLAAPEAHEHRLVLLLLVVPLAADTPTKPLPSICHPSQTPFHAALTTSPGTRSPKPGGGGVRSFVCSSTQELERARFFAAEPGPPAKL